MTLNKMKIYILTNVDSPSKEQFFKKKGVKVIKLKKMENHTKNLKNIFYIIKKLGFNRIIVESGVTFLEQLIKYNLIKNFYLFRSFRNLGTEGSNNTNPLYLKKINFSKKNQIKVNLEEDKLYKVKI